MTKRSRPEKGSRGTRKKRKDTMRSAKNTAQCAERKKLYKRRKDAMCSEKYTVRSAKKKRCTRGGQSANTLSNQNICGAADAEEAEEPPQQNGGHLLPVGVQWPLSKAYG